MSASSALSLEAPEAATATELISVVGREVALPVILRPVVGICRKIRRAREQLAMDSVSLT